MGEKLKKVAIFITSLSGGGAERIVSYLLQQGHREFEFHLVLMHRNIEYELPQSENIRIVELEGGCLSPYQGMLKLPLLAARLRKYLERHGVETLLSLMSRPNLIACRAKETGWRGRLIISERVDSVAHYRGVPFGFAMLRLIKRYYRYADLVTVISGGISHSLKKLGIDNCLVIHNPVYDLACRPSVPSGDRPFTFINVARLSSNKNQALLLRAFAQLRERDCRLVILGRGELQKPLERLAEALGLTERVEFAGFQSDVPAWLEKSDCFVFSSDIEGFGNVIVEALKSALPVISTDCDSGPREILSPQTDMRLRLKDRIEEAPYGLLTPVGSVSHLAQAMRRVMDDGELACRYRQVGPLRAEDFDVKRVSRRYFELF